MNRLTIVAATLIFLCSSTLIAQSQAPAPVPQPSEPQGISAEKRALAKELSEEMGLKNKASELLATLDKEMSKEVIEMSWQMLSAMPEMKTLTDAEREELHKQLREDSAKSYTRFTEALNRRIDYGQLIEDVSVTVYAKYFTDKELKDLIAFYGSDTGKRSMEVMPSLMADSMSEASRQLTPIMTDVMRDLATDDTTRFRDRVTAMAKAHHGQTTSKPKPQ